MQVSCTLHFKGSKRLISETCIKGAVSRQSSSFCLILPIIRPQSLWDLKKAKKLHANDKIGDPRQTNMSPEHYF